MKRLLLLLVVTAAGCRSPFLGASLSGRVVVTGQTNLGGIAVAAVGSGTYATATDSDGHYVFASVVDGAYIVTATGRSTLEGSASTPVDAEGPVLVPDLVLTPSGRMQGRVTRGGAVTGNGGIFVNAGNALAITTDSGDYHFDELPAGTFALSASATGFQTATVSGQVVAWDQLTEVPTIDLVADPSARGALSLRGIALLYGQTNHAGTLVTLVGTDLSTVTAADGSWEIDGVAEGSYAVSFANGLYHETIPQVLALAGSNGMVEDGALYALPDSPLTIYTLTRILSTPATTDDLSFTLSPDGTELFYIDTARNELVLAEVDGSGTKDLAAGPFGYELSFTADGAHIVYTSNAQLLTVPSDGSSKPLLLAVGASYFWLSPDSRALIYYGTDPATGNAELFATTVAGGTAVVVDSASVIMANINWANEWRWTGDGRHFLYRIDVDPHYLTGTIKLYTVGGGAGTTVASNALPAAIMPDSKHALLLADYFESEYYVGTLMTLDLSNGATTTIASQVLENFAVVVDNDRVLYQTMNNDVGETLELRGVSLSGAHPPTDFATVNGFTLSRDRSTIFWWRFPCSALFCTLESQASSGAGTPQAWASDIYEYLSADDGQALLYSSSPAPATASLLTAPSAQPHAFGFDVASYDEARFTADKSHVLFYDSFAGSGERVALASLTDGSVLTLAEQTSFADTITSPDFRRIAMGPQSAGVTTLAVALLDGTPPIVLTDQLNGVQWASSRTLVATRRGSPVPYRFQDGFYSYSFVPTP